MLHEDLCLRLIQNLLGSAYASEAGLFSQSAEIATFPNACNIPELFQCENKGSCEAGALSPFRKLSLTRRLCTGLLKNSTSWPTKHCRQWAFSDVPGITDPMLSELDKAVLHVLRERLMSDEEAALWLPPHLGGVTWRAIWRELQGVKRHGALKMTRLHLRRFGPLTESRRSSFDDMALRLVEQDAVRAPTFDVEAKALEFEEAGWVLLPGLVPSATADALYDLTMHLLHDDLRRFLIAPPQHLKYSGQTLQHLQDLLAGYGPYDHGLHGHNQCGYGLYSYGLCICGLL